jgi:fatty acid desaturase
MVVLIFVSSGGVENLGSATTLSVTARHHWSTYSKRDKKWTLVLRTVWRSNNLKLEQKNRKSNKESRDRHVVCFSLCLIASVVARTILPRMIQWASGKFSLFLELFIYLFIWVIVILSLIILIHNGTKEISMGLEVDREDVEELVNTTMLS